MVDSVEYFELDKRNDERQCFLEITILCVSNVIFTFPKSEHGYQVMVLVGVKSNINLISARASDSMK